MESRYASGPRPRGALCGPSGSAAVEERMVEGSEARRAPGRDAEAFTERGAETRGSYVSGARDGGGAEAPWSRSCQADGGRRGAQGSGADGGAGIVRAQGGPGFVVMGRARALGALRRIPGACHEALGTAAAGRRRRRAQRRQWARGEGQNQAQNAEATPGEARVAHLREHSADGGNTS